MSQVPCVSRGFTLLELVLAMIVMSVVAVIVMPVTVAATESYAQARALREVAESSFYAIDRVVRLVREAPAGASTGLGIGSADASEIVFSDGRGIRLSGTDLLLVEGDAESPLLRNVQEFELIYLEEDGQTITLDAAAAHRIHVRLKSAGMELTAVVFPRVLIGGGD